MKAKRFRKITQDFVVMDHQTALRNKNRIKPHIFQIFKLSVKRFLRRFCLQGLNFKPKFQVAIGEGKLYTFHLKILRRQAQREDDNRGKETFFKCHTVTVSYLFQYNTLLLNEIDVINKYDNYFITKCGKNVLQNISPFLL